MLFMEKVALQIYKTKLLLNVFVLHSHYNNYLLEIMIWWYRIHHIFYPTTQQLVSWLPVKWMSPHTFLHILHNASANYIYDEIKARCEMIYFLLLSLNSTNTQYDLGQGHPENHLSNSTLLLPLSFQRRVTQTAK